MNIIWREESRTFHLYNDQVSYIMKVLRCGQLGQLYFGKRVHDRDDFSYLLENLPRPMASCTFEDSKAYSLEHIKQEYPSYGTGDYRSPAVEILQENGSRISAFVYKSHRISDGKPSLEGLPATYTEDDSEARTLTVTMEDAVTGMTLELSYTIFAQGGIIARSARFVNRGEQPLHLTTAMSLCLDLPDHDYDWMQFSGAWARERYPRVRRLEEGILSVGSRRGHSSHEHNPFIILKRPQADEFQGEAIGFSLVYSGNFLAQAEVGSHDTTRVLMGIHPDGFDWKLEPKEAFQTPEAVMVYTDRGLNDLSQTFHRLYQKRLARGYWRDRERPILINNWEATYFDFTEGKILEIAGKARECGVEMFVLDDGWFGKRCSDRAGLGDWVANRDRLPGGIAGLAQKIDDMGMKFGLWFEPEMVNKDSDLYRAHPDWILHVPGRPSTHGRYQYVLDFSRKEVVDCIYGMMEKILSEAKISYIKWDMNRSITECYSPALPADRQGEVFHRYILGVYDLYDRLTRKFPYVLFESCASGGARFDPGMLYYAPQAWTSDDTDAVERLKIQYGTSYCYPVSSMGSHVSTSPNHQTGRTAPLHTRANVACFGTFGYELDLNTLTAEEQEAVKDQIRFMKEYRHLLQFGTFYRLQSPFEGNVTAWMAVSKDKKEAIAGWYRTLSGANLAYTRLPLRGLDPEARYEIQVRKETEQPFGSFYGDELMNIGLITTDGTAGEVTDRENAPRDFDSRLFILKAEE
ncbi:MULTISPECIES: alpha-galactosidase [Eubacteriales]|uniref:alpha-galactosidase n=1 Tax=Eubacteriales TaxID=186802 RepID=UPI00051BEFF5|nr:MULTISPECIES: alpha-galactosidase [Eubacteriales]